MTLREAYENFGGNYDEVLTRLGNEDFLKRILGKFLNDKNTELLQQALAEGNCEEAFRAVHTLKGLALNLSMTKLAESSSVLTERLRAGNMQDYGPFLETVLSDYTLTLQNIKQSLQ